MTESANQNSESSSTANAAAVSTLPPLPSEVVAPELKADAKPQSVARCNWGLFVACVIIAIVKLWMVRGEEIIARNSVLDGLWNMQSASVWYWGRTYDYLACIRPPGYPLWVAIVHQTGIPLRIAAELMLLFCGYVFVASVVRAGVARFVGVLMFAGIAFQPWGFEVLNQPTSDTLYAPMLLLFSAAMVSLLAGQKESRRIGSAFCVGLAGAAMWITREEFQLVAVMLVGLLFIAWVVRPGRLFDFRRAGRELGLTILIPAAVIGVVVFAINVMNFAKFGVFATSDLSSPGFVAANNALIRIKPDKPILSVPVTRDARLKAYAVSPAFAELSPYFEGSGNFEGAESTQEAMGGGKEIVAGGFFWSLREAAARAGHCKSATESEAYYKQIAREINGACSDGRLASRKTFSAFIEPTTELYLDRIPGSFLEQVRAFALKRGSPKETDETTKRIASPAAIKLFDTMANRRMGLSHADKMSFAGWVFRAGDPVTRVELRSADGKILASVDKFSSRPDVASEFAGKIENVPADCGFVITAPFAPSAHPAGEIVFISTSGAMEKVPFKILGNGEIEIAETPADFPVKFWIDSAEASPIKYQTELVAQKWVWFLYGWMVVGLSVAAASSLLVYVIGVGGIRLSDPIYGVIAILGVVVAARLALFTFLDASSGSTSWILRYMYPVTYLYTCLALILVYQAVVMAMARRPR